MSQTKYRARFDYIRDLLCIRKSLSLDLAKQIEVELVSGNLTHFFTICQKRISLDYNAFRAALQVW